jgi:hypothetical protein
MHDKTRPGAYILLITDGEPNCPNGTAMDPDYTIGEISKAAMGGIKTFAIGFGTLPDMDAMNMDLMAVAGGVPCDDMGKGTCKGRKFYAAEDGASLNQIIDSIAQAIVGEFTAACDDSCYANGCPNLGEICVKSTCKPDPCANVTNCAPGDYCYTDGNSPGTCVHACMTACATGETCTLGHCVADPCAITCPMGQACKLGTCVPDKCSAMGCDPGLTCISGSCIDDPCKYVTCPMGTMCITGTGSCIYGGVGTRDGEVPARMDTGCSFGKSPLFALSIPLLLLAAAMLRRRRA